jgi:hypothetical protein
MTLDELYDLDKTVSKHVLKIGSDICRAALIAILSAKEGW